MTKHWIELAILSLCLLFGGFLCSLVIGLVGFQNIEGSPNTNAYLFSALLTQGLMFFGATVLYFQMTKLPWRTYIDFRYLTKNDLLWTGLFFGIALLVIFALLPLSNLIETHFSDHTWVLYHAKVTSTQNEVIGSLRGSKIAVALLAFALLPAFTEELVFRGILYKIFKDLLARKHIAMLLSATIFSVFHFQVLSFIPILIVGYLLALLYDKTKNIWSGILLHFLFNAIQIIFW